MKTKSNLWLVPFIVSLIILVGLIIFQNFIWIDCGGWSNCPPPILGYVDPRVEVFPYADLSPEMQLRLTSLIYMEKSTLVMLYGIFVLVALFSIYRFRSRS